MRRTCNPQRWFARRRVPALLACAALFGASAGDAETVDERWNLAGWTPSIATSLGVQSTDVSGFIESSDLEGDPVRPPSDGQVYATVPMLRLSLSIESPPLPESWGSIRTFGSLDYFATFPPSRDITGEADPSGLAIRPGLLVAPEEAVEGQGSKLGLRTNRNAYGATAGLAVPFDVGGFRFFLKPGVSWMRQEWEIRGLILRAVKPVPFGTDFRTVDLRAQGKLYTQGVGPYLSIEIEPASYGPILAGLFAEAAYYRTLGDRDVNVYDSVSIEGDGIPADSYEARWGMKLSEDFWRAAVGVRLFLSTDAFEARRSR